jgi:hypothetical protein
MLHMRHQFVHSLLSGSGFHSARSFTDLPFGFVVILTMIYRMRIYLPNPLRRLPFREVLNLRRINVDAGRGCHVSRVGRADVAARGKPLPREARQSWFPMFEETGYGYVRRRAW